MKTTTPFCKLDDIFNPTHDAYPYIKTILDAIPHSVIVTNEQAKICYANKYYYSHKKMANPCEENFIGLEINELTDIPLAHDVLKDGKARYGYVKLQKNDEPYYCDVVPLVIGDEIAGTFGYGWEHVIQILKKKNSLLAKANHKLSRQVKSAYRATYTFSDFWGVCDNILKIKQLAMKMAQTDADILIIGESGTGKEILAQAMHNASRRAGERFVAINCATLSRELISSELFGYAEGAFTGAKKGGQSGLFEVAHKGTLLLDEISELDGDLQAKLLRVLEERCVRKVGSTEETYIDVRVIALSNKNLRQMVNQGSFRADLYYRLNVLSIEIPALRDRREDIMILARGILSRFSQRYEKELTFSEKAQKNLQQYTWPGNVRELRNAVDYAAYMCDTNLIDADDLPSWLGQTPDLLNEQYPELSLEAQLQIAERNAIKAMLKTYGYSAAAKKIIAEKLGISISSLYHKIKTMELGQTH